MIPTVGRPVDIVAMQGRESGSDPEQCWILDEDREFVRQQCGTGFGKPKTNVHPNRDTIKLAKSHT